MEKELAQNEKWVYPGRYRNELTQFLKAPLQDLCISRPKSRLEWGIELPFDKNFVTYVWFDALTELLRVRLVGLMVKSIKSTGRTCTT